MRELAQRQLFLFCLAESHFQHIPHKNSGIPGY
jgi:hypothetical protein